MTSTLGQLDEPVFTLSEGLREGPSRSMVHRAPLNEKAREDLLLQKLGARGWGRVYQFRYFYGSDWGDAQSNAPSPKAVDAFFRFLEAATFPAGRMPSVFLTDRGGIELCWEDEAGQTCQVEFTSAFAEYFRAASNAEGTVPIRDLPALTDILFTAHHAA